MSRLNRRAFLGGTAGAAGSLAFASAFGTSAFAQDVSRIRHFWWGNPERDKRTYAAIDIFNEAHPDIQVVGETLGFNDYFTRLTTQIAGGNMPDCIQQGYGVMQEYVDKGTMIPLTEFIGKTIMVDDIDESGINAGTFNGELYGLTIGANTMATVFNTRLLEASGETFDPVTWTYDDLKRVAVAISESSPDGVYGTDDSTADWGAMGVFAGQNGFTSQYTEDGKDFTHDADLVIDFWNMWKDIRDAGGAPPGAESAGLAGQADLTVQGVVTGLTAITFAWSNQIVGLQDLMQDKIGAAMRPHLAGGQPGQSVQPSQFICLSRDTVDPEAATTYMNAFVHDPEMTKILGMERGIPEVSAVRQMLAPTLSEAEAVTVTYFDSIQGHVGPLPPAPPAGNREIEELFERIAVNILLDRQSIEDTANQFMQEARAILRRA
jgi:multiple sugar transport system substrate-binding protein